MSSDIDLSMLEGLRELLAENFDQLLTTYIQDSKARYDVLKNTDVSELDTIMHNAHGLKGSSRNLGINGLAALCETLENQARDSGVFEYEQQLAAIEQKLAAAVGVLEAL